MRAWNRFRFSIVPGDRLRGRSLGLGAVNWNWRLWARNRRLRAWNRFRFSIVPGDWLRGRSLGLGAVDWNRRLWAWNRWFRAWNRLRFSIVPGDRLRGGSLELGAVDWNRRFWARNRRLRAWNRFRLSIVPGDRGRTLCVLELGALDWNRRLRAWNRFGFLLVPRGRGGTLRIILRLLDCDAISKAPIRSKRCETKIPATTIACDVVGELEGQLLRTRGCGILRDIGQQEDNRGGWIVCTVSPFSPDNVQSTKFAPVPVGSTCALEIFRELPAPLMPSRIS